MPPRAPLDRKYEQLTKRRGAIEREQAQLRSEAEPEAAFEPTPQANCRGIVVGARGKQRELMLAWSESSSPVFEGDN